MNDFQQTLRGRREEPQRERDALTAAEHSMSVSLLANLRHRFEKAMVRLMWLPTRTPLYVKKGCEHRRERSWI